MEFDTLIVVNMHVFLLSDGENLVIMKKLNITDSFFGLEFTDEVFIFPIYGTNVSFTTS